MNLELDVNLTDLIQLVEKQILNLFNKKIEISEYVMPTLERVEKCFSKNKNKYYVGERVKFSPFHSGQYAIFLFYLSNTIYKKSGNEEVATKIYYLNKVMNSVDWYFELELPEYFGVEHPLGSVLGRAKYSNGLFLYQGCTVGGSGSINPRYPILGNNVILYSNSKILGESVIGDNVILSTDTTILNENIPSNSIVFGKSPNLIIKRKSKLYMEKHLSNFWNVL